MGLKPRTIEDRGVALLVHPHYGVGCVSCFSLPCTHDRPQRLLHLRRPISGPFELIKDARLWLAVVLSTSSSVFSGLRDLVDLVHLVVRNVNNQI